MGGSALAWSFHLVVHFGQPFIKKSSSSRPARTICQKRTYFWAKKKFLPVESLKNLWVCPKYLIKVRNRLLKIPQDIDQLEQWYFERIFKNSNKYQKIFIFQEIRLIWCLTPKIFVVIPLYKRKYVEVKFDSKMFLNIFITSSILTLLTIL